MTGGAALSVRELVVGYGAGPGAFELRVPALDLRAGEVLAVLGPNGAGKTTLLRAMAGLLRPRAGRVVQASQRPVALVFQRPLALHGSVAFNAQLPLWARSLPRAERRRRAAAALERFQIAGLARRSAATLSGGELRRLALARAFVGEPGVLLLDEPFDDLDLAGREALSLDLRRAIAGAGVAVAMVTHELQQALLLAERVAVLLAGRLVQVGPRDEVVRRPAGPGVARLVGMANLAPGAVVGRDPGGLAVVELAPGVRLRSAARAEVGDAVFVGVRPEHLKLDQDKGDPAWVGRGVVRRLVDDGVLATAWIEWGGLALRTHLIAGRGLGHLLRPGDPVHLAVRPEDVHLMPR